MTMPSKICAWCGVPLLEIKGRNQKYHPECAKKVAAMRYYIKAGKEKFDRSYEVEQAKKEEEQNRLIQTWCGTCQYGMRLGDTNTSFCDYFEMMGCRRPCPSVLDVLGACEAYKPVSVDRSTKKRFQVSRRERIAMEPGRKTLAWKSPAEAAGKRETEQAERPEWAWFLG